LGTNQKLDQMLGGVSTFLKIPRSANNSRDKAKSERRSYLLERFKDPIIFEDKYVFCFPRLNRLI